MKTTKLSIPERALDVLLSIAENQTVEAAHRVAAANAILHDCRRAEIHVVRRRLAERGLAAK